jgi:hypothetical protein
MMALLPKKLGRGNTSIGGKDEGETQIEAVG